jgi:hypothetical protein
MTLRQPTERHGGTARFDEEPIMVVSKTLASLDSWLAQAERVLAEQSEYSKRRSESDAPTHVEAVQLCFDLGDV